MALGMWQGILAGLQDVDEKRALREAKEAELLEKRKALALELATKYGTDGLGSGLPGAVGGPKGSGASGGSIDHYSQVLKSQYGASDEAILKVARTAGAAGLEKVTSILEKQRLTYEEMGAELPKDLVSNLFDNAVLTGPQNAPLDFTKLEEFIGGELDPLEKELLARSQQQTGQAYFPEPGIVQPPKLTDVNELEDRVTLSVVQQGEIELRNLNKALNELTSAQQTESDPTRLTEIKGAQEAINSRQMQINDALESAKGEGGNPSGLINLYGNQFFQEVFQSNPQLKNAPISPIFRENLSPTPRRVNSQLMLEVLVRNGVLKAGDTFEIYNKDTEQYEPGELY